MKLKEYVYMAGLKPREKRYGYTIRPFHLDSYGTIEYAQWDHPSEKPKTIQEANVAYLCTFLHEGDFCIDIGAHTGDTALPMALAVGKKGFVLALEPNPFVFTVLNKNSSLNTHRTNILPLMIAAAEKDGDMVFTYSDAGFCNGGLHENISKWKHGHAFTLTVTGRRVSDILHQTFSEKLQRLRYIKVDTEGYDLSVLKSLNDIIETYTPFIKTEIYKYTDAAYREEMHSLLSKQKYVIHKVNDDHDYRGKMLNKTDMMRWEHYDIFCVPDKE